MSTKLYYSYNPETFVFVDAFPADLDPLETELQGKDVFMLPGSATWIAPPVFQENNNRVFNPETQTWGYQLIEEPEEDPTPEPQEPPPPPAFTSNDYYNQLDFSLDHRAVELGYRDAATLASYFNSSNVTRRNLAQAFVNWRDQVVDYADTNMVRFVEEQPSLVSMSMECMNAFQMVVAE